MNKLQTILTTGLIALSTIAGTASAYEYQPPQTGAEYAAQDWVYLNGIDGVVIGCRPADQFLFPGDSTCQVAGEVRNGYRHIYTLHCADNVDQAKACGLTHEEWRPVNGI